MTASRIQVGASQDFLNTNKVTTSAGEVHNSGGNSTRPTDYQDDVRLGRRSGDDDEALFVLGMI